MSSERNFSYTPWGALNLQWTERNWDSWLTRWGIGPEVQSQTAQQSWQQGAVNVFALAANTFVDTLGLKLSYSATLATGAALPAWLKFDATTGTFSGVPTGAPGALSIRVTATDTAGISNSEVFTLTTAASAGGSTIKAATTTGSAPSVTAQTANQTWLAGQSVALALPSNTFTDPQSSPLTYKATLSNGSALPSWLKFNATTDSFSGTVGNTAGTYSVKVTATDGLGLSTSETFSVTVIGTPIVSSQTANQVYAPGASISLTLSSSTFTDPQGSPLSYAASLSSGAALPSWLKYNATNDSFSGTMPSGTSPITIKVTATDSYGLSASESFTLSAAGSPVVSLQTANQIWTQGQSVSFALSTKTFTDPQGSKLTYAATQSNGSALPSWLKFNAATETFTGTVPTGTTGLSLKVTATDSFGLSASETFSVATPAPAPAPAAGLVINITYDSSVTAAPAGFKTAVAAAVSYLQAEFTNNLTLNINVGYGEVGGTAMVAGALGESMTNFTRTNYSTVVNALTSHATSPDDQTAVASLSGTTALSGMSFLVSTAEAKALGITSTASGSSDGSIGISSAYPMTYDPANRAVAGAYDAIGVIEHEITEVMGRVGYLNSGSVGYTPLDLFRYTGAGALVKAPGAGSFSIDGGKTLLQAYNNPVNGGDTTDWTSSVVGDAFGSGYTGTAALVTAVDLREMDVIGWTRASLTS